MTKEMASPSADDLPNSVPCERCDATGCPECDAEWEQHQVPVDEFPQEVWLAPCVDGFVSEFETSRSQPDYTDRHQRYVRADVVEQLISDAYRDGWDEGDRARRT